MVILVICMLIIAWLAFGFSFYLKLAKEDIASGYTFEFDWGIFLILLVTGVLGYIIYGVLLFAEKFEDFMNKSINNIYMEMNKMPKKIFKGYQNCCKKCGSVSLHTEEKGNNTGLYCDDCGSWQKWLNKDELRTFLYSMREATQEEDKTVLEHIKTISKPTGCDFYDDKTVIERLTEFKEHLNNEIDAEIDKFPVSPEDAVRKNSYCFGLQKVIYSIENIIAGRDFNDAGE